MTQLAINLFQSHKTDIVNQLLPHRLLKFLLKVNILYVRADREIHRVSDIAAGLRDFRAALVVPKSYREMTVRILLESRIFWRQTNLGALH